jgi:hypothetical protein
METNHVHESRISPTLGEKLVIKVGLKVVEATLRAKYGKDGKEILPSAIAGICVDGMIGTKLCYPDPAHGNELILHRPKNSAYLSYDPRRPEYFPAAAKQDFFTVSGEGSLAALMINGIEEQHEDELTLLSAQELVSAETLFSFDKPGLERLIELGMLARRTHEDAFEHAGLEDYIGGLRSRSMHDEIVYQVTPKGNTLVMVIPDGGDRSPKLEASPLAIRVPGILTSPA